MEINQSKWKLIKATYHARDHSLVHLSQFAQELPGHSLNQKFSQQFDENNIYNSLIGLQTIPCNMWVDYVLFHVV